MKPLFAEQRSLICAEGYDAHSLRRILAVYDEYVAWSEDYLKTKVIVFKFHFNELWMRAYFYPWNSKAHARRHNTAMREVTQVLRTVGVKYHWLRK